MNIKTKRGKIPALRISREFLVDFGVIVESEVVERNRIAEQQAVEEIQISETEIRKRTYFKSDDEKNTAVEEMKKRVRTFARPHVNVTYNIDAKDEDLTFSSIQDILDTKFFPEKIKSFYTRVSHYGETEYVDISVRMSQHFYGITAEYQLSSVDNGRLLSIEDDLKNLFRDNKTSYQSFLYPSKNSPYGVLRLFSFLSALFFGYFIFTYIFTGMEEVGKMSLCFWISFIFYNLIAWAFKSLYPYFSYTIVPENSVTKIIRTILVGATTFVLFPALYDLAKYSIHK